jgi:hypothetical protein
VQRFGRISFRCETTSSWFGSQSRTSIRRGSRLTVTRPSLTQHESDQLYWEIISTFPDAVSYEDREIKWDEKGKAIEWQTIERVDPDIAEIARRGVAEVAARRDGAIAREHAWMMREAELRAQPGGLLGASPQARRSTSFEQWLRAMDWAGTQNDEDSLSGAYSPGGWGRRG